MADATPNLKAIFAAALDLPNEEERNAYIAMVCGEHAKLRQEVESLLAAHRVADGFLSRAASKVERTLPTPPLAEHSGTTIGRYTLLEEIGEGGMGMGYLAEQKEPFQRRVALKIVKPGMDTREVVARFEAERHALAMMDHPNIARALDAGATESGRPYFVMDLVRGTSITAHCDQQNLTTRERLELFISVCHAVQHAH
jgi:hypothetical protein